MWVMPGTRLGHVNFFKIESITSDDQSDDHLFDSYQHDEEEEEEEEEEHEQQEEPCSSRSKPPPPTPPTHAPHPTAIGATVLLEDTKMASRVSYGR